MQKIGITNNFLLSAFCPPLYSYFTPLLIVDLHFEFYLITKTFFIMENQITSNWYMVLIKGIIMILLAFMVFSSPGGALLAYAVYIGIALFITGFLILFRGISSRKDNTNWGWLVFEGLLDIFAAVLPFVFGFWAVFYGILLLIGSFSETENKTMKIISGILLFIIGAMIMRNPIFAGMSLAIWVAVLLLIAGIYNVIISFSLKKAVG